MKQNILVVEDDAAWRDIIVKTIRDDHNVQIAEDAESARVMFLKSYFDLILLDNYLPGQSGVDFCAFIRNNPFNTSVPILILSARNELDQKIAGFSVGADDYIVKPFEPVELKLKIKATLRRGKLQADNSQTATVKRGPLIIDINKQKAFRTDSTNAAKNIELDLTQKEFKLLLFLAKNEGVVFERKQIIDAVYLDWVSVCDRNIDSLVSRLRKKLGPLKDYIRAIYGSGYTFQADSQQ